MGGRKSDFFLLYVLANVCVLALFFAFGHYRVKSNMAFLSEKADMVRSAGLTDLCLFTEARYTRNLSLADRNTPFQDYPFSLDFFPSGTIVEPPAHLRSHELD
jgi:hypothetical protein